MTDFRLIRPIDGLVAPIDGFGAAPLLRWIDISLIVIEPAYQREISDRGVKNIRQIVENFRWSRFAPVIVAPREDGRFALIDGQHRTTALATLGLKQAPAQIVEMTPRERAEAFTYINGAVTPLSVMAKFHAAVAAGEPNASAAQRALSAAKARLLKYPVPSNKMKVGDTLAATTLISAVERFGEKELTSALKGLVARARPGDLCAPHIDAATRLVKARPDWKSFQIEGHIARLDLPLLVTRAHQRKVGLSTKISVLLFQELEMATPKEPTAAVTAPSPGAPSEIASGRALDEELMTLVATKAGIVFGCSRIEVFRPQTAAQLASLAATYSFLVERGYASAAILRRLPGAAKDELEDETVGLRETAPKKFERFESLVFEALKHRREAV